MLNAMKDAADMARWLKESAPDAALSDKDEDRQGLIARCAAAARMIEDLTAAVEREKAAQRDPIAMAQVFMAMSLADFKLFWLMVQQDWNNEDSDIEAVWHHFGTQMRAPECSVIGALHAAIESGKRKPRAKAMAEKG